MSYFCLFLRLNTNDNDIFSEVYWNEGSPCLPSDKVMASIERRRAITSQNTQIESGTSAMFYNQKVTRLSSTKDFFVMCVSLGQVTIHSQAGGREVCVSISGKAIPVAEPVYDGRRMSALLQVSTVR